MLTFTPTATSAGFEHLLERPIHFNRIENDENVGNEYANNEVYPDDDSDDC